MSLPDCEHDLAYKHPLIGGESYCCACLRAAMPELLTAAKNALGRLKDIETDTEGAQPSRHTIARLEGAIAKAESSR